MSINVLLLGGWEGEQPAFPYYEQSSQLTPEVNTTNSSEPNSTTSEQPVNTTKTNSTNKRVLGTAQQQLLVPVPLNNAGDFKLITQGETITNSAKSMIEVGVTPSKLKRQVKSAIIDRAAEIGGNVTDLLAAVEAANITFAVVATWKSTGWEFYVLFYPSLHVCSKGSYVGRGEKWGTCRMGQGKMYMSATTFWLLGGLST